MSKTPQPKRGALARIIHVGILERNVPPVELVTDHDPDAVDALAKAMVLGDTGWPESRCDEILQALYLAGWALVRLDRPDEP